MVLEENQVTLGNGDQLHENQVPDLHIPAAFAWKGAIGVAKFAGVSPKVIVNLRTWTARSSFTHLPEIVLLIEADDSVSRYLRSINPYVFSFIVFTEDCYP